MAVARFERTISGLVQSLADRVRRAPMGEVHTPISVLDAAKLQRDLDEHKFTTLPRGTTVQLSVRYKRSDGEIDHAFLGNTNLLNNTRVRPFSSGPYLQVGFWLDSPYRAALESQSEKESLVAYDIDATEPERTRAERRAHLLKGALSLVENNLVEDLMEGKESMLKRKGKDLADIDPNSVLDAELGVDTTERVFLRRH